MIFNPVIKLISTVIIGLTSIIFISNPLGVINVQQNQQEITKHQSTSQELRQELEDYFDEIVSNYPGIDNPLALENFNHIQQINSLVYNQGITVEDILIDLDIPKELIDDFKVEYFNTNIGTRWEIKNFSNERKIKEIESDSILYDEVLEELIDILFGKDIQL